MKIKKITWKNIYSYGNNEETLEFSDSGLWQLFGRSGAGKSTIVQMPQLLFYGKTMEKNMKKDDIANRINKHGVIVGDVECGSDLYTITRKFEPDGLELKKNGTVMDFATKVECQKYIESIILSGLPIDIYKNVIALSLNNFTSFVTIGAADKRNIIDNVFSMDVINDCAASLKTDKKLVVSEINSDNGGIAVLDGNIKKAESLLESKTTAINFDSSYLSKEGQITDAITKIDEKTPQIIDRVNSINKEYSTLATERANMSSEVGSIRFRLQECESKINLLKQDKCPTCGSSFSASNFLEMLSGFEETKAALEKEIVAKNAEIEAKIAEINAKSKESSAVSEELKKLNAKKNGLNEWLVKINAYKSASASIDETKTSIADLKADRKKKEDGVKEKMNLLDMYNILETVYSDNGVKKYHREKYIPTLNNELKAALEALEFPYQLSFDTDFNANLYDRGEKINIASLSAGERKRVDVCVLCSLIRIIKQKYPAINVIALDETISSLDYETSVLLLKYLKQTASELGLNIIVVSHTTLDESMFDTRIFIEKHDRFSVMKFC